MRWLGEPPPRRAGARLPPPCGPQGLPEHERDGQGTLRTEHPRTPGVQAALTVSCSQEQRENCKSMGGGGMFRIKDG